MFGEHSQMTLGTLQCLPGSFSSCSAAFMQMALCWQACDQELTCMDKMPSQISMALRETVSTSLVPNRAVTHPVQDAVAPAHSHLFLLPLGLSMKQLPSKSGPHVHWLCLHPQNLRPSLLVREFPQETEAKGFCCDRCVLEAPAASSIPTTHSQRERTLWGLQGSPWEQGHLSPMRTDFPS